MWLIQLKETVDGLLWITKRLKPLRTDDPTLAKGFEEKQAAANWIEENNLGQYYHPVFHEIPTES